MYKIGNRAPTYIGPAIEEFSNEDTEMNYSIHRHEWDQRLYVVAADHDAVGLVTYYDATPDEVNELRKEAGLA